VGGQHEEFTYENWQNAYRGVYKICTNQVPPYSEALFFQLKEILVKRVVEVTRVR